MKYYTPNIEEFFIGFEYEIKLNNGKWEKHTFKPNEHNFCHRFKEETWFTEEKNSRVKYLDKEDLEELGWTHIKDKKDPFYGRECYFKLNIEPGFNTGVNYLLTLYPKGSVVLSWETYSSYQNEQGKVQLLIKNKSEFKKFMSQLKIM